MPNGKPRMRGFSRNEQLRANQAVGQNIDEIKRQIGELTRNVLTKLTPYASAMARGIIDHLDSH